MGLLEKAQDRNHLLNASVESVEVQHDLVKDESLTDDKNLTGLLAKAKLKRSQLSLESRQYTEEDIEIFDEKRGFGWKGLGSRRIFLNKKTQECLYEVFEPGLNKNELEVVKELSHLFKMLADVNISYVEKEEKKKYLEVTLNQIIVDNNIKFIFKEEKEGEKKSFKDIFKKSSNKNEEKKPIQKEKKRRKTKQEREEEKKEIERKTQESRDKIFYHIFREFLGYGPIDILMEDTGIEDISCDGHHVPVFIYHKKYSGITTNIQFENKEQLDSFVVRLSQICGKQISIYSPIVDGKLPDGSRLQTTLANTVTKPSTFTIRRFRENPLTPIDLIDSRSLSIDMAAYFWMAIEKGASILFCGGTASGKTTALNALSLFIPLEHKIVTIEDTREISLPHRNWIAGTTRQGFSSSDDNKTGKDIDMFDLIRAALRQRPKVIMVGEVRGREAYSLFQAMATGHTSYATVHASTIHTLIQRLENPPISLPRALLTSLDIIVFQNAVDINGKTHRRMTSVTEVIKLDPDTNQLIFMEPYNWVSKTDDRFENSHSSKVINNIKTQNDWTEEQLQEELESRKLVLKWMSQKNIRDYKEVGKIVYNYQKNPENLLKRIREELQN
ncbi:MAG: type II/IV secretion system ATPase subunit [Candidatus Thermoplasmatota archaeon]|nr:type II/IV secretion system ATPase subunit [Candidatus Thermoplasmatota archaeon]